MVIPLQSVLAGDDDASRDKVKGSKPIFDEIGSDPLMLGNKCFAIHKVECP
jgi:hypothetical protein